MGKVIEAGNFVSVKDVKEAVSEWCLSVDVPAFSVDRLLEMLLQRQEYLEGK